jgi:hypothetical protein
MKARQFKILAELPEEYEYELFTQSNGSILIVGLKDREVIAFTLKEEKLQSVNLSAVNP